MTRLIFKQQPREIIVYIIYDDSGTAEMRTTSINLNKLDSINNKVITGIDLSEEEKKPFLKLFLTVKGKMKLPSTYDNSNFKTSELCEWYEKMVREDREPSIKILLRRKIHSNHEYLKLNYDSFTMLCDGNFSAVNASM